jgi:hypothetical protein
MARCKEIIELSFLMGQRIKHWCYLAESHLFSYSKDMTIRNMSPETNSVKSRLILSFYVSATSLDLLAEILIISNLDGKSSWPSSGIDLTLHAIRS